ncbi:MAG: hypothetical protein EBU26_02430 [Verrucomicrobia bacterium]|jgi:hypothetical protein|nr:hypothetical protein [Verrucomicrobiota bacterium]
MGASSGFASATSVGVVVQLVKPINPTIQKSHPEWFRHFIRLRGELGLSDKGVPGAFFVSFDLELSMQAWWVKTGHHRVER